MTDRPTVPTVVERLVERLRRHHPHCNSVVDPEAEGACDCHRSNLADEAADLIESQARELAEARGLIEHQRQSFESLLEGSTADLADRDARLAAETFKRRNLDLENAGLIEHVASLAAELAAAHREREEAREWMQHHSDCNFHEHDEPEDADCDCGLVAYFAKHTQEVGP